MLRQQFLQHLAQTSPAPLGLEIERAEGVYLYEKSGKRYLDLISGIGPNVIGHRHPAVIAAITTQVDAYLHTLVYGEYILSPQVRLATLLADLLPAPLDNVYLTNSGAEATEGAMKLAKRYTGRNQFVSCYRAYHGSTQGALSLMHDDYFSKPFRPLLPNCIGINFNNFEDLEKITEETAAVVIEPVQAESGIIKPVNDYLKAIRQRCTEVGALLIFDEVQTGCGRTGFWWAMQRYDVVPDIVLLAKGLGGGMPIGAFVARKEVMQTFTHDPVLGHITTFGGHPVSAAAAVATLLVLQNEPTLINSVCHKEAFILDKINAINHPMVKIVSCGLWASVSVGNFDNLQKVIQICLGKGLITDWFLFNDYSLRIAPPLTITDEELAFAMDILVDAIKKVL